MTITEDEQEVSGRQHWRLLWLSSIQAFSDTQTQRTRWLDTAERNPHFSFVECMCSYFDDAGMGDENAFEQRLAEGYLTPEEVAATKRFHALADSYDSRNDDDYNHADILEDPAWQAVVEAAQSAKTRLLSLELAGNERDALLHPVYWEERSGAFYADALGSRIVPAGQWVAEQSSTGLKGFVSRILGKLGGNAGP